MARFRPGRFGCALALALWSLPQAAKAQEIHYHYVAFDEVPLPSGLTRFFAGAIQDSGRVYGTACDDMVTVCYIAVYAQGTITVSQTAGFGGPVNASGTVGGSVPATPENPTVQAALFHGDEVELIPPQPGELFAFVIALNDPGTALVDSYDGERDTFVLYRHGEATPLDFGPTIPNPRFLNFITSTGKFINNQGVIAGTTSTPDGARGFRFDTSTGEATLLEPVSPANRSWGLGINSSGDVLGYSFTSGVIPYHERIGVWDHHDDFQSYIFSNRSSSLLVFNDNNMIAVSLTTNNTSYLVPKPGVRLDLIDLVDTLPPGQDLNRIFDINNHGDLLGTGPQGDYLLERIGGGNH